MSEFCEDCRVAAEKLKLSCTVIANLWTAVNVVATVDDFEKRAKIAADIDTAMKNLLYGDGNEPSEEE